MTNSFGSLVVNMKSMKNSPTGTTRHAGGTRELDGRRRHHDHRHVVGRRIGMADAPADGAAIAHLNVSNT